MVNKWQLNRAKSKAYISRTAIDMIIKSVCRRMGVDEMLIPEKSKPSLLSDARKMVVYFALRRGYKYKEVMPRVGYSSNRSARYAYLAICNLIETDNKFRLIAMDLSHQLKINLHGIE